MHQSIIIIIIIIYIYIIIQTARGSPASVATIDRLQLAEDSVCVQDQSWNLCQYEKLDARTCVGSFVGPLIF